MRNHANKYSVDQRPARRNIVLLDIEDQENIFSVADENANPITRPNTFLMELTGEFDNVIQLIDVLHNKFTVGMTLEELIDLLKNHGVSYAIAETVRQAILAKHISATVTLEGFQREPSGLVGSSPVKPASAPIGKHTAQEQARRGADENAAVLATSDAFAIPTSWEEAKAQVPSLTKWVNVKKEAGLTGRPVEKGSFDQEVFDLLVAHARDAETGLGRWAASNEGLPRNLLRKIDSGFLQELYVLGNPEFPEDVRLPQGKPTGRPVGSLDSQKRAFAPRPSRTASTPSPSEEELREARRIVSRANRERVRRQLG